MVVYGIDLGTTFSCIGFYDGDSYTIIGDSQDNNLIKSQVKIVDDVLYVGNECDNIDGGCLLKDTKRFLGKKCTDNLIGIRHYDTVIQKCKDTGNVTFRYNSNNTIKFISPLDVSRAIIKHLVDNVKVRYQGIKNVVITAPSYYSSAERSMVITACTDNDLNVLNVINEPTAASLYNLSDYTEPIKGILLLDIGGSTTDITILEYSGNDFVIRGSGGDLYLGGMDIDKAILKSHNLENLTVAERMKIEGNVEDIEKVYSFFYKKLREVIFHALELARVSIYSITKVIVVGGSSRLDFMYTELQFLFLDTEIEISDEPDLCVCLGACLKGYSLDNPSLDIINVFDVLPLSIGVETCDGKLSKILYQNERKPSSREKVFNTESKNQSCIILNIYEGDRVLCKYNYYLGSMTINLPTGLKADEDPVIIITFSVNHSGILSIYCKIDINNTIVVRESVNLDIYNIKNEKSCLLNSILVEM